MPLTVDQVAALPDLGLVVRTTSTALDRQVRWVSVSELPDPVPWLDGGELLLTTGMGLADDPAQLREYVARLADADVAALGFGVGIHHPQIPSALLDEAAARGLPVLEVPRPVPFVAIGKAVLRLLSAEEYAESAASYEAQRQLIRAALKADGDDIAAGVAGVLARHVGGFVLVLGRAGQLVCASPPAAADRVDDLVDEVQRLLPRGLLASSSMSTADEHLVMVPIGTHGSADGFLAVGSTRRLTTADQAVMNLAVSVLSWHGSTPGGLPGEPAAWRELALAHFRAVGLDPGSAQRLGLQGIDVSAGRAIAVRGSDLHAAQRIIDSWPGSAVCPAGAGLLAGLVGEPDEATLALVAADAGVAAIGLSAAHDLRAPEGVQRALDEARQAATSGRGVRWFGSEAATGVLGLVDHDTARAWAIAMLGPLQDSPDGPELRATVRAWLRRNGQVDAAAGDLGVHRHTVRHRLRRVENVLQRSLDDPGTRADLWQALSVVDIAEA